MIDVAGLTNTLGFAAAIAAAARAGLLAALVQQPGSAENHARILGLDPRATRRILEVLVAFGLATRGGDRFAAEPALIEAAIDGRLGLAEMTAMWAHTHDFLVTGAPYLCMDGSPEHRQALYAKVVSDLGRRFATAADELASRFERPPARVLDVGCGSGVWSLAFVRKFTGTRVTGLDLPEVLPAFAARASAFGLAERVDTLPGDMHEVEIPRGVFDLVIIANVLRLEEPARAAALVGRAAAALLPGGRLIVVDALGDGSTASQQNLAVYALHLAMRTSLGRVHEAREIKTWMTAAGLVEPRDITLSPGLGPVGAVTAAMRSLPC